MIQSRPSATRCAVVWLVATNFSPSVSAEDENVAGNARPAGLPPNLVVILADDMGIDVAGAKVPSELAIDGRSSLPTLSGQPGDKREWTYCWYARNGGKKGREFARNQRFKARSLR